VKEPNQKQKKSNERIAARQPGKPSRDLSLTDEQLERWNAIRERGGFGPVSKADAEKRLGSMPDEVYAQAMERIS